MEALLHFLIFGGLLQPALSFDAYLTDLSFVDKHVFLLPLISEPCHYLSDIAKMGHFFAVCFNRVIFIKICRNVLQNHVLFYLFA